MSLMLVALVCPAPSTARAAAYDYYAQTNNLKVVLNAGEKKQITLSFTNIGNNTWYGSRNQTALYLYGDSSIFGNASWLTNDLPGLIAQSSVKPGQNATASFWVQAPKTPGTYNERFLLSYGINKWVKGSVASVEFDVVAASSNPVTVQPAAAATTAATPADQQVAGYAAVLVDKGGIEWQIAPGGMATVNLSFKNTGIKTWYNTGSNYVSVYTGKTERKSQFEDTTWKNQFQPVVMKEASVKPGEIGHFTFKLKAPTAMGRYTESFQLAAEDAAWIPGGTADLPIKVASASATITDLNTTTAGGSQSGKYSGVLLLSSARSATLLGNGRQTLTYGFKNTGTAIWNTLSIKTTGVSLASADNSLVSVRDESWYAGNEAVRTNNLTEPGHVGFVGFTIKAPAKKGNYTAHFVLYADNNQVDGATIDIPITVTADGYIEPEPTSSSQPSTPSSNQTNVAPLGGDYASLPAEPIIRVGLYQTNDDTMIVRAVSGGFSLQQNGSAICTFNANEQVKVVFDRTAKVYKATGPRCTTQSSSYYVAAAPDNLAPLEITDISRPVSWLPGANDNKFRGKLELRYTPATDLVWVINELPIEWYLKGIGETSNSSPLEYQKALLTAARTYAMYHVQHATKHADEYYIVDAKYDQVYRGYGAEIRDPKVVEAIDATRGQIVTYQGKLAITPYYSRSDGRTRSWTEVWGGGPYGWLVSVPVPWDQGKTLWGHGVGMSATGALGAANDGWLYDKILKYFYTGIDLVRIYK